MLVLYSASLMIYIFISKWSLMEYLVSSRSRILAFIWILCYFTYLSNAGISYFGIINSWKKHGQSLPLILCWDLCLCWENNTYAFMWGPFQCTVFSWKCVLVWHLWCRVNPRFISLYVFPIASLGVVSETQDSTHWFKVWVVHGLSRSYQSGRNTC